MTQPVEISPQRLAAAKVLVVGDAMLDRYWYGAVDRISPEAPVPVVRITRTEDRLGAAANVAANIAQLSAQAALLTVVGDDDDARALQALLSKTGITPHLCPDAALKTIVKLRVIGRQQQLIRLDFENKPSSSALTAQQNAFEAQVHQTDVVLLSDYAKGSLAQVQALIATSRAVGKPVLIDPKGSNYAPYRGATVLTPNRHELEQVIGTWAYEAELAAKAQNLREQLELDTLLFTRSEDGMTLFDNEGRLDVAAQALEVFDVTGAGDTVIAVLATLHAAGLTLRQALPHANRAGGIVVGKFGTAGVSYAELFRS